jgi:hypothetical protein
VWKAKKEYAKRKEDVVKVQSLLRSANAKRKYKEELSSQKKAASVLQRRIRGTNTRKQHRKQLFGVVPIQAVWRGGVTRMKWEPRIVDHIEKRRVAAASMQSMGRMRAEQKNLATFKHGIGKLQGEFRRKAERRSWLRTRLMLITVQCLWRRFVARKLLRRKQKEAKYVRERAPKELAERAGAGGRAREPATQPTFLCERSGRAPSDLILLR